MGVGHPLDLGKLTSGHTLKEEGVSLPQVPSTAHSSSLRGKAERAPSPSMPEFWLPWSSANNHSHCEFMGMVAILCQKMAFRSTPSVPLVLIFSLLLFHNLP